MCECMHSMCIYSYFFVMVNINLLIMQQAVANNILETKYLALLLSV